MPDRYFGAGLGGVAVELHFPYFQSCERVKFFRVSIFQDRQVQPRLGRIVVRVLFTLVVATTEPRLLVATNLGFFGHVGDRLSVSERSDLALHHVVELEVIYLPAAVRVVLLTP
jgi:hypothetical protein